MNIDVHNHFIGEDAREFLMKEGAGQGLTISDDGRGGMTIDFEGRGKMGAEAGFFDIDLRLKWMEERGIDAQLVTIAPSHCLFGKDASFAAEYLAVVNNHIARLGTEYPGKFFPTATVPLQDVEKAVAEAHRAVNELNARAVFLTSNVNGGYMDAPKFDPLYDAAQELGVPLFVHPAFPPSLEGMGDYHLSNICGFPFDQTLNLARMVLSGVYERFPRLQAFYTHGGGTTPFLRGRWNHAFQARDDTSATIPRPPSDYLQQIWLGSMVFYPPTLEFVVRSVGVDHVCLGSDYPYDMADPDPAGTVRKVASLSEPELNAILGGNAKVLFDLHP